MSLIASQITSLTIVYSTVYSDTDQRKYQSSAPLAFVWGIHRGPVNSPHKWPVTRKMFPLVIYVIINPSFNRLLLFYHWLGPNKQLSMKTTSKIRHFIQDKHLHTDVSNGIFKTLYISGSLFTKKTPSYWYRDSHHKSETVVSPSSVCNGDPYTSPAVTQWKLHEIACSTALTSCVSRPHTLPLQVSYKTFITTKPV